MAMAIKRERCLCDQCTRIVPMQKRILDALPEELRKDFEYLCMKLEVVETDLAATEAKLYGEWPGWEWIKEARKNEEYRKS